MNTVCIYMARARLLAFISMFEWYLLVYCCIDIGLATWVYFISSFSTTFAYRRRLRRYQNRRSHTMGAGVIWRRSYWFVESSTTWQNIDFVCTSVSQHVHLITVHRCTVHAVYRLVLIRNWSVRHGWEQDFHEWTMKMRNVDILMSLNTSNY